MIEPNNLRNRWRRYKQARDAYGWVSSSFRDWARYGRHNPTSYSTRPGAVGENVRLINGHSGMTIYNPKRKRAK